MLHRFSRTELLIGAAGLEKLRSAYVAVIGIGGVGSFAAEALARAGVGRLLLVDHDEVCLTNINRQIHALTSTVGQSKVEAMAARISQIDPTIKVEARNAFFSRENAAEILSPSLSYVIDAVDTVTAKLGIITGCHALGLPVISCMGAGNKLDPTQFTVTDIAKTATCPLARIVRKELRKRGISRGIKVVYSPEPARTPLTPTADCTANCICPGGMGNCTRKRQIPGSISFVPAVAGLMAASVVVRDLLD
ncbi:MAG: tRNA threonylcarbamoyladenosine dehydratase [Firmicutes bacterium]|nr:tRNA threonylcarbamoyladenosine dehydratase [Dethiobacter sp.]MBS3887790.1 tRNA threonylcarbamoyladenosine dehydratase [Bacillota bacterium]MBS4055127.1 tRNA threonylcarbamoyladenosine dehydratase [Thermaerobacter sp.]